MERTVVHHKNFTVRERTGTEGPRHDPYGFRELTFSALGSDPVVTVKLHLGLGEWVEVREFGRLFDRVEFRDGGAQEHWESLVGYKVDQFLRWERHIKQNCPKGGRHHLSEAAGYPGETLYVCEKCRRVVDVLFCREDVE